MPTNNRIVGLVQKKVLLAVSKLHYIILNSVVLGIEHKLFELVDLQYRDTVGTESIQTPLNFSLFVILQPFAKII